MGIGGGAILIPGLVFLANVPQHIAQGTNLVAFIPAAFVALIIYIKNKYVKFKIAIYIIISGLISALLGSKLAVHVDSAMLRRLFGIFLLVMGLYELFRKEST